MTISETTKATTKVTVKATIQSKLVVDLNPEHIDVLNESHQHNVPENSDVESLLVTA